MKRKKFKFFILFLILLSLIFLRKPGFNHINLPLVKVDSRGFKIGNKPFRFIGANTVYLVFYDDFNLSVEKAIKSAKKNNISVIRLYMDWGWSKPKDYDKILDIASKYGIYVILTLTDCVRIEDYSGLNDYLKNQPFCDVANSRRTDAFKKRIKQIILRKNSINGKTYKDDTTIFAWNIANEIDYWSFESSQVKKWIREIASYVKLLDPNHLVTIGVHTDYPAFDKEDSVYKIFDVPELDFFAIHYYLIHKNWDINSTISDDYKEKVRFRIKKFLSMGKPVILEEFGFSNSSKLNTKVRSDKGDVKLYCKVLKDSMDIAFSTGTSGVMFWSWGIPEAKRVSMWWASEIHDITDESFVNLIRKYNIAN